MTPTKCVFCEREFESVKGARYCSPECQKRAYYEAHKKYFIEKSRKWRKDNPERRRENRKAEYWKDPEGNRRESRMWAATHKEEKARWRRIYNDKIRHGGKREKMIEEQGHKCSICGRTGDDFLLVAHHLLDKDNHEFQILLCQSCHARLHNSFNT